MIYGRDVHEFARNSIHPQNRLRRQSWKLNSERGAHVAAGTR
jgi:hypothetical protein